MGRQRTDMVYTLNAHDAPVWFVGGAVNHARGVMGVGEREKPFDVTKNAECVDGMGGSDLLSSVQATGSRVGTVAARQPVQCNSGR